MLLMPTPEREPCTCDWLQRAADDPRCPIKFDAEVQEYHVLLNAPNSYLLIRHCPWCGGKAPQSKRSLLFHILDDAERQRLVNLTENLRTVQDVLTVFGEPDRKHPAGFATIAPERDGNPEITTPCRTITYQRLSKVADVEFAVYPGDLVGVSFRTKSLKEAPPSDPVP